MSKSSINVSGKLQGGHETVGTAGAPRATEISICPRPSSSPEADPTARWSIAREELITAATITIRAAAVMANFVPRVIELVVSLCRCGAESKIRRNQTRHHLTRNRLQLAVYFWLHGGKCALKGGKLASHKRAWKNRFYDKILLVISWDRILGASPKGHLVCCMVILTRFG